MARYTIITKQIETRNPRRTFWSRELINDPNWEAEVIDSSPEDWFDEKHHVWGPTEEIVLERAHKWIDKQKQKAVTEKKGGTYYVD